MIREVRLLHLFRMTVQRAAGSCLLSSDGVQVMVCKGCVESDRDLSPCARILKTFMYRVGRAGQLEHRLKQRVAGQVFPGGRHAVLRRARRSPQTHTSRLIVTEGNSSKVQGEVGITFRDPLRERRPVTWFCWLESLFLKIILV